MKLSKTQQELFDAIVAGEIVYYTGGIEPYCFRQKGMKKCTSTVFALEKKGLLERYNEKWNGHKYRAKSPPPPEQNK